MITAQTSTSVLGEADLRIAHVAAGVLSLTAQTERGTSVSSADSTAALPHLRASLPKTHQHVIHLKLSPYHPVLCFQ